MPPKTRRCASNNQRQSPKRRLSSPQDWLFVEDIKAMFGCGDSKARGIMRELPCVRIGKRNAVRRADMGRYIDENGGVAAKWPKRKR